MDTTELTYPIFEANQVLTNAHLNDLFEYLDEQQRLTRANLIGIGIVCGLDVELAGPGMIRLSRGCGITSHGYLIVEPVDLELVSVRQYQLPVDDPLPPGGPYAPFVLPGITPPQQYDLWELFPDDDVPGAQPLQSSGLVLDDKALVLFLELRRDGLRNCSPNNCDDRGTRTTATVRRLLVDVVDLDKVLAAAPSIATLDDLGDRLALPDLRIARFDVPNSEPVDTEEVLAAFQAAFRGPKLARQTGKALSELYAAFRPLVVDTHPTDPFALFVNRFGFLDTAPATTTQVQFMQYYWDLFSDLLTAYDEVRWAGVELMCACCPPEGLFPRHLVAGVLAPVDQQVDRRRHRFIASPAVGDCERETRRFGVLFDRMVTMIAAFTETPSLPPPAKAGPDRQIRVTPTRWGDAPLGERAIPYYYEHKDAPPLYRLWDPVKTDRRRAHHNLGYRADEYAPVAPPFTADPLRFDLEPNDFLRIEGHLGKNVRDVVSTLLAYRDERRLPVEVVALRTGAFDETIEIDLTTEECRFEDLDTLYATLRSELTCFLAKQVRYFYELPSQVLVDMAEVMPTFKLLRDTEPDYRVRPGTLGRVIEANLAWRPGDPFVGFVRTGDVVAPPVGGIVGGGFATDDLTTNLGGGALGPIADRLRPGARVGPARDVAGANEAVAAPGTPPPTDQPDVAYAVFALTSAMTELAAFVPNDIRSLDAVAFADRYQRLVAVGEQFDAIRRSVGFERPGLSDRIDDIVFRCRLDPLEALAEEYRRRIRDVKQAQFLAHYAQHHPGLQHRAGVPLGGTFVLVYHESPASRPRPGVGLGGAFDLASEVGVLDERFTGPFSNPFFGARANPIDDALAGLRRRGNVADDPDVQALYRALTGKALVPKVIGTGAADLIYTTAVGELNPGAVIADFFLPYQCCSGCSPIHYTLPTVRLRMDVAVACTGDDDAADVTVTVEGASGRVSVQVDGGAFTPLDGPLHLAAGTHTIVGRDDGGAETTPTTIDVPPQLTTSDAETTVNEANRTYQVAFQISGGTPPYVVDPGTVAETVYQSPVLPGGEQLLVTIRDAAGCTLERRFDSPVEPCNLPCGGAAERRGHRFWIPEARVGSPINRYQRRVSRFVVADDVGNVFDLTQQVGELLDTGGSSIDQRRFDAVVERWLATVNDLVASEVKSDQWLVFGYEPAVEGATVGTLWIDRLRCLDIDIQIEVSFVQDRRELSIATRYDRAGTEVQTDQSAVRIPPYDGSMSSKCESDEQVPLCEGAKIAVEVFQEVLDESNVMLIAKVIDGQPVALLWEIPGAVPSLANGDQVTVTFESREPGPHEVTLTAYDEQGCTIRFEHVVELG